VIDWRIAELAIVELRALVRIGAEKRKVAER
jgi:hypothetical protein